jgi:heme-degrading monooxygenase HmoA
MRAPILVLVLGFLASSVPCAAAGAEEGKVLRHIVMYKFKPETTPAQIQEVIDAFSGLPKKIDTIVGFEAGANVSKEGKSEGFTHVFVVTFKSEADLAAYIVHPAHEAYVKVVKDKREKVVVFDYWAEGRGD